MRTVLLFGFIACIMLACTKAEPNLAIDSGLEAAFDYQKGTYWIYKDSLSGRIDSLYVIT